MRYFQRTPEGVRTSCGKQAISVGATEGLLYVSGSNKQSTIGGFKNIHSKVKGSISWLLIFELPTNIATDRRWIRYSINDIYYSHDFWDNGGRVTLTWTFYLLPFIQIFPSFLCFCFSFYLPLYCTFIQYTCICFVSACL